MNPILLGLLIGLPIGTTLGVLMMCIFKDGAARERAAGEREPVR